MLLIALNALALLAKQMKHYNLIATGECGKRIFLAQLGDSLNREQLHSRQSKYEAEIELVDAAEKYGNPDTLHTKLYK